MLGPPSNNSNLGITTVGIDLLKPGTTRSDVIAEILWIVGGAELIYVGHLAASMIWNQYCD